MEQFINDISNDRNLQIFYCMLFVIVADLMVGAFFFMRGMKFLNNSIPIMARIVEVKTFSTKNGMRDRLTVQYEDKMGRPYENVISDVAGKYHNGGQVGVLCDPKHPEKIRSNNKIEIFIFPIIMMVSALTFGIIFGVLVFDGVVQMPISMPF